jgi:hypothetical protein
MDVTYTPQDKLSQEWADGGEIDDRRRLQIYLLRDVLNAALKEIDALKAEVATLTAMRDTLNAVFTIEAPAAAPDICDACDGSGKWTDSIGTVRLCKRCDGMGEVQP